MTSFNVLDRKEQVHRHLMLEASAGTGKTFAIENIVVRLLIEANGKDEPLLIENILVVTFTRMAVSELKERIHSNLEKSLQVFKRYLQGDGIEQCPDYLLACIERGREAVNQAKKSIERALFTFDKAQIFTIHGFCWRMLKSYSLEAEISLDSSSQEDQSLSVKQLRQVVRDFLRKEVVLSDYSPQQLKIIMKRAKRNSEQLQQDLLKYANSGMKIASPPSFRKLLELFQQKMGTLKRDFSFEGQKILEDFLALAPSYKELRNTSKQIHPEKWAKAERFAGLFDKTEWKAEDFDLLIEDGLFLLEAFDPNLLMAKAKPLPQGNLHFSNLLEVIKDQLQGLVEEARSETFLFARLASDCQKFLQQYLEQEEMFGHDDLLIQMRKAINKPEFVRCVRSGFLAAIVDEFQDTDPVQWEIFSLLFAGKNHEWKGFLNLVGDPKQSIYAFRQADIYTYLSAAETLGANSLATLDTNFRSQSTLIDGLNILFSSGLETFSLPKTSQSLPYRPVKAGRKDLVNPGQASIHFWEVRNSSKSRTPLKEIENSFLFPAIAKEILRLNENEGLSFGEFAILIADRFQADRICHYLKALGIPVKNQKSKKLSSSPVVEEMRDLLKGVLNYHSKSELNIALAGRLIGMKHAELLELENEELLCVVLEKFHRLKQIFNDQGFSKFYDAFMKSSWHVDKKNVFERLLNEKESATFYREWQDLADLLIIEENSQNLLPQGVLAFLDDLEELAQNDDGRIKVYMDPDEEAVSVLTTHVSKGLEFGTVFALGLSNRSKSLDGTLIPLVQSHADQKTTVLGAVENSKDPRFLEYCEEIDAEKMRQLYVGLTRAKDRLYIPFIIDGNSREVPLGRASPIELFLARLGRPLTDYQGLYQRISSEDGSTLSELLEKFPSKMTLSVLSKELESLPIRKETLVSELIPPDDMTVPGFQKIVQSFTSLAHMNNVEIISESNDDILNVPHEFSWEEKTEHTLPSGSDTGVILHKIFEELPFHVVKEFATYEELKPLISPFLHGTPYDVWEDVIAKIVFNTLKTSLVGSDFCLADINPKRVYKETEFLYSCDLSQEIFQGTSAKPGFLKGIVDVFFEYEGKFYIVDWKSNWLGPTQDYYQHKHLEEAMRLHQYDLQAEIYYEAFRRYLKIFDQRPFEEIFGGVYYIFLRGVSAQTGILRYSTRI